MWRFNLNHLVAFLTLILSVSVYLALRKLCFPDRICLGAAFLSILVIAIFWSAVIIHVGNGDEE
jgi:hypothetical protein